MKTRSANVSVAVISILVICMLVTGIPPVQASGLNEQLMEAVKNDSVQEVKTLLEKKADPNSKAGNGWTPLTSAALDGHLPIIKLLLDKGADVNLRNGISLTPLICAAERGHTDIAKLLLDKGANIDLTTMDGSTALLMAIDTGHAITAKFLVEKGADPNSQNFMGRTPLIAASGSFINGRSKEFVDLVRTLLSKGAQPNRRDSNKWTPLMLAARAGNSEIVKLLVDAGAYRGGLKRRGEPKQPQDNDLNRFEHQAQKAFIAAVLDSDTGTKGLKKVFANNDMVHMLKEKAEKNDPRAQFLFGLYQSKPWGVVGDDKTAESYIKKSAEQGYGPAQVLMAAIACEDDSDMNKRQTWTWLEKAGRIHDVTTQTLLQAIVLNNKMLGKTPGVDNGEFVLKCAKEGNAFFQLLAGDMYADGAGVTMDTKQALEWYKKSADQGYAMGQFGYGLIIFYGRIKPMEEQSGEIPQDKKKGVEFILSSAEKGFPYGQLAAGAICAKGKGGVPRDRQKAIEWVKKAADQGLPQAKEVLLELPK